MSEESEVKETEVRKSNALMSALFDAADADSAASPESQLPQIRTLSDIVSNLPEELERAKSLSPNSEVEPEPEPSPQVSEREVPLQPVQSQPQPQPVQPVQQVVQQVVQETVQVDPEEGLLSEQKERLKLARLAEEVYKRDPDGSPPEYRDMHSKYLEFYKKESAYVSKQIESGESLEWDEDYKRLKESLDPAISDTIIRKLEREDIKKELSGEMGKQRQEISKLKNQLHRQSIEPKVVESLKDYSRKNYEQAVPEDLRAEMDSNKEAFRESRPFEYEAISNTLKNAERYVSQFERVNNGLERYETSKHGQLASRIESLGQIHKQKAKTVNGKSFVTRSEYSRLTAEQRESHYTWDADGVKGAFMAASKATIQKKVKEIQEKVSKYNGSTQKPHVSQSPIQPTPRTATPRTPAPVGENKGEVVKSNLASMLLD